MYHTFDADIQVGSVDPADIITIPTIALSWSDDRGITYGFPVEQTFGAGGNFLTVASWNRLAYARDRIFRLQWSAPIKTALNGGFVNATKARS